jgi:hypothetical protein
MQPAFKTVKKGGDNDTAKNVMPEMPIRDKESEA